MLAIGDHRHGWDDIDGAANLLTEVDARHKGPNYD